MSAPTYKTKGELRSELLIALGYGGLGAGAAAFVPRADYLLEQAQENLYLLMPDEKRIREWDMTTGLDQIWYDFPTTCDPDRIIQISAFFEQTWLPMARGINVYHDSTFDYINYYPQRYDIRSHAKYGENIQTNHDFTQADSTAEGTAQVGWNWLVTSWKIEDGIGKNINNAVALPIISDIPAVIGKTYKVTYTIVQGLASQVSFGSVTVDDSGVTLKMTAGTHTHIVTATGTPGLSVSQTVSGVNVWVDNVIIVDEGIDGVDPMIELWPTDSDNSYNWKIEGYIQLGPFVDDSDRASIDDRLILLYAEAYGKAHLNKPDAGFVMDALKSRLKLLRGQQHGEQRYVRGKPTPEPIPRPIVIP